MHLSMLPLTVLGLLSIIWDVGVLGLSTSTGTSSTATFLYPDNDGLIINIIDTVVLQWKSNYATPWMQMWCQNGTAGNNVVLGSNVKVQSTGNLPFVMVDDDPDQTSFPVACHYQLATAQNGGGVDSPVGVTFVSLGSSAVGGAKTFSLSSTSTSSSASSSVTATKSTSSPTTSPTTSLPSNTSPALATNSSTATAASTGTSISGGVKAGIGIGIAVAVVGIIGVAAYIFRRRRRTSAQTSYGGPGIPELSNDYRRHEMAAPHGKQELYSDTTPQELYSNSSPENTKRGTTYEMAG